MESFQNKYYLALNQLVVIVIMLLISIITIILGFLNNSYEIMRVGLFFGSIFILITPVFMFFQKRRKKKTSVVSDERMTYIRRNAYEFSGTLTMVILAFLSVLESSTGIIIKTGDSFFIVFITFLVSYVGSLIIQEAYHR